MTKIPLKISYLEIAKLQITYAFSFLRAMQDFARVHLFLKKSMILSLVLQLLCSKGKQLKIYEINSDKIIIREIYLRMLQTLACWLLHYNQGIQGESLRDSRENTLLITISQFNIPNRPFNISFGRLSHRERKAKRCQLPF